MKCFVSFAYYGGEGQQGFGNGIVALPGRSLNATDAKNILAWANDVVTASPEVYGSDATAVVLNMVPLRSGLF